MFYRKYPGRLWSKFCVFGVLCCNITKQSMTKLLSLLRLFEVLQPIFDVYTMVALLKTTPIVRFFSHTIISPSCCYITPVSGNIKRLKSHKKFKISIENFREDASTPQTAASKRTSTHVSNKIRGQGIYGELGGQYRITYDQKDQRDTM